MSGSAHVSSLMAAPTDPSVLTDNFNRKLDYLRIAVTDRCNLRCTYCMPEEGISLLDKEHVLSYAELERLVDIFLSLGVRKVRITGGEPFVRADLLPFLASLARKPQLEALHITTNGVLVYPYLEQLQDIGIAGINFSLDTLDNDRFLRFTRRNLLPDVKRSLFRALELGIPVKTNTVVQHGRNVDEIIDLAALAQDYPMQVRFIEQMPFGGKPGVVENPVSAEQILAILRSEYPGITKIANSSSTASVYEVPGFKGTVGIISGYSRTFCERCSRVRITSAGIFKTCLYDAGIFSLREALRCGVDDEEIAKLIIQAVKQRYNSGNEAEQEAIGGESMAAIGG